MKIPHCDREQEVVDALRSGRWANAWSEGLRQHVAVCAVCAEVAWVAQAFQREAELARAEVGPTLAGLPSAGLVWWKAQLALRRAAEQRATAPIVWFERTALVLGAFAVAVLGTCQRPQISAWLQAQTLPATSSYLAMPNFSAIGEWIGRLTTASPGQTPALLVAASATAFLTLMVFSAYVVWRED